MEIIKILSKATNLAEALDMLIDSLNKNYEKTHNLKIKEKISAIQHYSNSIHNKTLIATRRTEFNGLYSAFEKGIPEMNFYLDGNKKAFKSFLEKIEMLQVENKSLDSAFKDIHRFRVTITNSNTDNPKIITLLEKATIITIEFFLSKGYTLCQPNPLKDVIDITNPIEVEKFKKEHPNVFLLDSKDSIIPTEYTSRIKNYVVEPKKNGYQRIHVYFSDSKGNLFEVQLGTFSMQIRADYGKSSHIGFKESTRKVEKWDMSKINIPGFMYLEMKDPKTGNVIVEIVDNVGIITPVETFVRRKTF